MTFDWLSFWIGVVAGPAALALGFVVLVLASTALATNHGRGGCHVCDQGFACETGEYTRMGIWFRSRRHNWFIRNQRWHREAWANNRWNPYRRPGVPDDNASAALRRPRPNILVRVWWAIFD
jgi:hypothetical protein